MSTIKKGDRIRRTQKIQDRYLQELGSQWCECDWSVEGLVVGHVESDIFESRLGYKVVWDDTPQVTNTINSDYVELA